LVGNLFHLSRRGLTSFERRFFKKFKEPLPVLVKKALSYFECLLQINGLLRMGASSHLHVSMPHVEEFADLLVTLLPIFHLTSPRTIQGGLASSAVLEPVIR
jgi:hypothetical protein